MIFGKLIKVLVICGLLYMFYKSGIHIKIYDYVNGFVEKTKNHDEYTKKKKKYINKIMRKNSYNDEV